MSMLDATERTRPIMEYVRDMEAKVRQLRNKQRRFHLKWFLAGCAAGAALASAAWLLH